MELCLAIIISAFLSTSFAQTPGEMQTTDGKTLNEGDAGYHDCVRQIGTKK